MVFGMLVIQQGGSIVKTNAGFRRQLFSEKNSKRMLARYNLYHRIARGRKMLRNFFYFVRSIFMTISDDPLTTVSIIFA